MIFLLWRFIIIHRFDFYVFRASIPPPVAIPVVPSILPATVDSIVSLPSPKLEDVASIKATATVEEAEDDEGRTVVNDYTFIKELGSGAFATVYLCEKPDGSKFAIKQFSKKGLSKKKKWNKVDGKTVMSSALQTVKLEIALMKKLNHANLCSLHEIIDDDDHDALYMVIEFVQNGQVMDFDTDTLSYKRKGSVLTEDAAKHYFLDLVLGMEYCK